MQHQQGVAAPNQGEAEKVCKHKCKNEGCGWVFGNKLGLRIHQASWCQWARYYKVEKILDHRCTEYPAGIGKCEFLIKWQGYNHSHNQWRPYEDVTKAAITEYLKANNVYDYSWRFRCQFCDKPCRSKQGVRVHYAAKCKKREKKQAFAGTVAQRLHTDVILEERQVNERQIKCGKFKLKNCYKFKYPGSIFTSDGKDSVDIRRRIGMAVSRCGQLRFILGTDHIKMKTKMKTKKNVAINNASGNPSAPCGASTADPVELEWT